MSDRAIEKYHLTALAILWAVVHGVLFWHFGIRSLYDSALYVRLATELGGTGRLGDPDYYFYAIPISILALSGWLFSNPVIPFIVIQCLMSGLAVQALYIASSRIFGDAWPGFFSGVIYLLWWDNIHWNTVVMTESMLCSVTCYIVYYLSDFSGSKNEHFVLFLLSAATMLIRPTGVVIVGGVLAFLVYYHRAILLPRAFSKILMGSGFVLLLYWSANFMFSRWDFTDQYKKGNIVTYSDTMDGSMQGGEGLRLDARELKFAPDERPPLYKMGYFILHNPLHFAVAAGAKVWYLVSGVRPYYGWMHNVFTAIWMSAVYLCLYLGWMGVNSQGIKIFSATVIVVNCGLIAISTVDWDNRFFIPMEPGIAVLAGGGAMIGLAWTWRRIRGEA